MSESSTPSSVTPSVLHTERSVWLYTATAAVYVGAEVGAVGGAGERVTAVAEDTIELTYVGQVSESRKS